MESNSEIAAIQSLIANRLDPSAIGFKSITGIIGDGPSQYSRSPGLWNAAFSRLGLNAIYLPFDIDDAQISALLHTLRRSDRFMGVNVTVPHKVRVIDFLDSLDADATRIGAVNTVVKHSDGKLVGYNTDGAGFIDSLLRATPGERQPFIDTLDGMDVLLLGAGGSARAVAFHLSDHIGQGKLIIANRTRSHAEALAAEICKFGRHALGIDENGIPYWARRVGLIVNSTTKGQGGVRKLSGGGVIMLTPYSALAPANPPVLADAPEAVADVETRWQAQAQADVASNNQAALAVIRSIPQETRLYDLIYHPTETVFLREGQSTGHRIMNGRSMIVRQAVLAFCKRVCLNRLSEMGKNNDQTFQEVTEVMFSAW